MLQVSRVFCITAKMRVDVADGSKTEVSTFPAHVRFSAMSGHSKSNIMRTRGLMTNVLKT
jgi:hypothetical protein